MPERGTGLRRLLHGRDQTQPNLRREVANMAAGVAAGGLLLEAGSSLPRSRFGTKLANHISFLSHHDTRFALGALLKLGGNASILYSFSKGGPLFDRLERFSIRKSIERGADFKSNGLVIKSVEIKPTSKDSLQYGLPPNVTVGSMDFIPDGRTAKNADKSSSDMLNLITGLQEYFAGVDEGKYPAIDILYGKTNKLMARWVSDRLGFIYHYYPDDKETDYYAVGETRIVRKMLEELTTRTDSQGRTIVEKLASRVRR